MNCAAKLQASNASTHLSSNHESTAPSLPARPPPVLGLLPRRRPRRSLALSVQSVYGGVPAEEADSGPSVSSQYTSSVGSSSTALQLSQWNLTQRHVLMLNVIACAAAVSATWLFCSAIPTLLALKRAAESLEKLMDVTREELPDTMAAVRLSGMEISDLTMELSDLGQDITQGVRSSTRAVRVAEERLRQLTSMASPALLQGIPRQETEPKGPALARAAKGLREGIVKGRSLLQMLLTLTRFSRLTIKNEIVVLEESLSNVERHKLAFLIHGSANNSNFKDSLEMIGSMGSKMIGVTLNRARNYMIKADQSIGSIVITC